MPTLDEDWWSLSYCSNAVANNCRQRRAWLVPPVSLYQLVKGDHPTYTVFQKSIHWMSYSRTWHVFHPSRTTVPFVEERCCPTSHKFQRPRRLATMQPLEHWNCSGSLAENGGFPNGAENGGFISWKIQPKHGWWLGVPSGKLTVCYWKWP